MEKIEFLVLQKRLYSDSSLILKGISPDRGRLDFLARGARRYGKKLFPEIDIFRCFNVHFRLARSGLHCWREADLMVDYSALARVSSAYQTACWLARFALANTVADNPAPGFCRALKTALARLRGLAEMDLSTGSGVENQQRAAAIVATLFVYLQENGLLDLSQEQPQPVLEQTIEIIRHAADPMYDSRIKLEDWREAYRSAVQRLHLSQCVIPAWSADKGKQK